MSMKPMLFNTKMVRAILDGIKGSTRRIAKGFIPNDAVWGYTAFTPKGYISCRGTFTDGYGEKFFKLPCKSGDILYVRETWTEEYGKYYYHADYKNDYLDPCETLSGGYPASCRNHPGCDGCMATSTRIHWHPSIHMPKEAARIWLKVTDVRVERLHDITGKSVLREGINSHVHPDADYFDGNQREVFAELWDSTIKKSDIDRYGWDANPWVWVIEFERRDKPESEE